MVLSLILCNFIFAVVIHNFPELIVADDIHQHNEIKLDTINFKLSFETSNTFPGNEGFYSLWLIPRFQQ